MAMNIRQFLLIKLAEEAAEISQIALKTAQFGETELCPGLHLSNVERIYEELNDLNAIIELLHDSTFHYVPCASAIEAKKEKVEKYLRYSISLGMVE